jgi:hypothetical protein
VGTSFTFGELYGGYAMMRPALFGCLAFLLACASDKKASIAAKQNPLEVFVSSRLAQGSSRYCEPNALTIVEGPPHNRGYAMLVRSCIARVGNTIEYSYRDTTGQLLVVGHEVETPYRRDAPEEGVLAAEIQRMRDSLRKELLVAYGLSARCPLGGPEQWEGQGYYVLLSSMRGLSYGTVIVERRLGEPSCHVEGAPHAE